MIRIALPKELQSLSRSEWDRRIDDAAIDEESALIAAMNLMYSEYRGLAKEIGQDNPDFYAKLAKAFLCDEDAVEGKMVKYYGVIVEH